MKARVKATGKIVEVEEYHKYLETGWKYKDNAGTLYKSSALDFSDEAVIGYWTRLEHQYAGMAMQGMIRRAYEAYCDDCANYENMIFEDAQALLKDHAEVLADVCVEYAHALVEKMKEEK